MTVKEAIDFVDKEHENDSIILELYEYVKDLLLVIETDENNTIKKLQEQIEKMKCCQNCKHNLNPDEYIVEDFCNDCKDFNKWEMKE